MALIDSGLIQSGIFSNRGFDVFMLLFGVHNIGYLSSNYSYHTSVVNHTFLSGEVISEGTMSSELIGYAFTSEGWVLKTVDGGYIWDEIYQQVPVGNYDMRSITAIDDDIVLIGGKISDTSKIWKSTDGGLSFSSVFTDGSESLPVESISYPTPLSGFASTVSYTMKSVDAGSSWVKTFDPLFPVFFDYISMADENIGYSSSEWPSNYAIKTTDGTNNWSSVAAGVGFETTHVYTVDTVTSHLCGAQGRVYKTTDGGTNWTGSTLDASQRYESIHFDSTGTNGVTAGLDSAVWVTSNGGLSWTEISVLVSTAFLSVFVKG